MIDTKSLLLLESSITKTNRPLIGRLQVKDFGTGPIFADVSGPRRVLFCSDFTLLRIYHDNPVRARARMDLMASCNYQGARIFRVLGSDYEDDNQSNPLHVTPKMCRELIVPLIRDMALRGLKVHLTEGHQYNNPTEELDQHTATCNLIKDAGLTESVALYEYWNEYWQNRYGYSPEDSEAFAPQITSIVNNTLSCLTTLGARTPDETQLFERMVNTSVCDIHGTRVPIDENMKRSSGLYYWGRYNKNFPYPFWQGEPAGPGNDSYNRLNDPASLLGEYGMHGLTAQASNYFSGAGFVGRNLDEVWGFREIPKLLENIPEDIGLWTGPSLFRKDNQFIIVTLEEWDQLSGPDFDAVQSWQIIGPYGIMNQGTGKIQIPAPGWTACIVKGSF